MRVAVHDLTKRFGPLAVVNRTSFSIGEGELFTLLGPSGCGKTTLLRLIAGFYAPDEGEVRFDDQRVNDMPPHERGIGMVFQNYALWPHMTVFDNVAYGLRLRNVGPRRNPATGGGIALEKVRLVGLGDRYPGQLSGGQQQRVALARALVLNPPHPAARRAAVEPGRQDTNSGARRDPKAAKGARHHHRLRDARPGRSAHAVATGLLSSTKDGSSRSGRRRSCTSGRQIDSWRISSASTT